MRCDKELLSVKLAQILDTINSLNGRVVQLEERVKQQQVVIDSIVAAKRGDSQPSTSQVATLGSARTCNDLHLQNPGAESGWYWIDPNGPAYGEFTSTVT